MFRTLLSALSIVLLFTATSSMAATGYDFAQFVSPNKSLPMQAFPDCCRQPEWWDEAESLPIRSIDNLYEIWQDKSVPDRQKARSFFQAIRDYQNDNDEITATAIALYPNVDRKYPDLIPLLEYGVARYFQYDSSRDRYVGPSGDRSAGLVRHLARQYRNSGRDADAVHLLAGYMAMREADTNPHLQQLISLELARSLDTLGRPAKAYALLGYALDTYDGDWDKRIAAQRLTLGKKLSLVERFPPLSPPFISLSAALVVLLFGGLFAIKRRRRLHA